MLGPRNVASRNVGSCGRIKGQCGVLLLDACYAAPAPWVLCAHHTAAVTLKGSSGQSVRMGRSAICCVPLCQLSTHQIGVCFADVMQGVASGLAKILTIVMPKLA